MMIVNLCMPVAIPLMMKKTTVMVAIMTMRRVHLGQCPTMSGVRHRHDGKLRRYLR
jgi:hypothetical protein